MRSASIRATLPTIADLVAPPACVMCGTDGTHLCRGCVGELREPVDDPVAGLDRLVVLCAYDHRGRDLVLSLKRRNRRGALPLLAGVLAETLLDDLTLDELAPAGATPADSDMARGATDGRRPPGWARTTVTWAPTTPARRRTRGFDQAQLLASELARALGIRSRRLLERASGEVTGASRSQRLSGVSFRVARTPSSQVLLVDDVVTTGVTMSSAAATLRKAGADSVIGVALARAT